MTWEFVYGFLFGIIFTVLGDSIIRAFEIERKLKKIERNLKKLKETINKNEP